MALTTINGSVTDIKRGSFGIGLKVVEEITIKDNTFKRSWMAWFKDEPNVAIGATVTVSGSLTVKLARDPLTKALRTYPDKVTNEQIPYLDWALNDCVLDPAW